MCFNRSVSQQSSHTVFSCLKSDNLFFFFKMCLLFALDSDFISQIRTQFFIFKYFLLDINSANNIIFLQTNIDFLCFCNYFFSFLFQLSFQHKIGILYCKAGQSTEEEMYNNEMAGPAFEEFLDLLGQRVRLKGFSKYRAQLDNKSKLCFWPMVGTAVNLLQISFYLFVVISLNFG